MPDAPRRPPSAATASGDCQEPGLAPSDLAAPATATTALSPPAKKQAKRGRPSKGDAEVWTQAPTETLFTVRYVTAKEEFKRARNHVEVGAAWVLVATLVNKAEDRAFTVNQCKDKMKWLKKKWSLYRTDRCATGNVPKAAPPPCLELMLEHWAPNPGMQNTALCDLSTGHDADVESDGLVSNGDDYPRAPRNKRKKTNGECVEGVLRALADGVKLVGEAMKDKASITTETTISREVVASLARQEDALQQQTAASKELILALRGGI